MLQPRPAGSGGQGLPVLSKEPGAESGRSQRGGWSLERRKHLGEEFPFCLFGGQVSECQEMLPTKVTE